MSASACRASETDEKLPKNEPSLEITPSVTLDKEAQLAEERSVQIPDGGIHGWMSVAGSWLILFATLGHLYSFGVYEDYYTRFFLRGHSPSSIAWMGSFQMALPFAFGPIAGRIFDAGYSRTLIAAGSLLFAFSLFMLSFAREGQYYQIFLSQGVGMGLGTGFIFTPSTAILGIHFQRRRSLAYGTTFTGISIGALVFPILLNKLIFKIGFAATVRITGYITLGCLVAGLALIRTPPHLAQDNRSVDVVSIFRDTVYLWFLLAAVVAVFSIYFPAFYLQLFAVKHNIDTTLAFYSIAILNGVSIVGRLGAAWLADRYGVWNVQIPCTLITAVSIWALLGTNDSATLIIISCLYGIFSGAWLAVNVSGLVSLSPSPKEVGVRVGIANAFMSAGLLASGPVQGALLTSSFHWARPIVFSATLMTISVGLTLTIRALVSRRNRSQWV